MVRNCDIDVFQIQKALEQALLLSSDTQTFSRGKFSSERVSTRISAVISSLGPDEFRNKSFQDMK
jgi:hypothetical protein